MADANPPEVDQQKKEKEVPTVPISQKIALVLPECSALSGMKVYALRSAIWAGDLPFIRSGSRGRYLIRREALEKFLRSREEREAR